MAAVVHHTFQKPWPQALWGHVYLVDVDTQPSTVTAFPKGTPADLVTVYEEAELKRADTHVLLLVQRQSAARPCHHCHQTHEFLIVQVIEAIQPRHGHGTQVMTELVNAGAPLNIGILLQSAITEDSQALARKLHATPHRDDPYCFDLCRIPSK